MQNKFSQLIKNLAPDSLVLLDIDSTLFLTHTRNQQILREFGKEISQSEPVLSEAMLSAVCEPMEYGLEASLNRIEKSTQTIISHGLKTQLQTFWAKYFFAGEYLKYDILHTGAKELVKYLNDQNTKTLYLTGRHKDTMLTDTVKCFENSNLPTHKSQFILKADPLEKDELYKSRVISDLKKQHKNIVLIDNEPLVLNQIATDHPDVELVFVDTCHSPNSKLNFDMLKIKDLTI